MGIPVICEKALTTSYNEIERIKELGNSNFISVVFNYVCYPMLKELKQIIKRGELGKITQVQIEMQQEGFLRLRDGKPMKPQAWRLVDGIVPTISLDLGSHTYSIVKFLTDETPLETIATENSFGNFPNVIDDINSIIKYSNDVVCNMWYSKISLGHRNGMKIRIYGSLASVFWEQIKPEIIIFNDITGNCMLLDRNSPNIEIANSKYYNIFKGGHPAGFIEALTNYYNDIHEGLTKSSLSQSNQNVYGIEESIEGLKLFEAINRSSITKNWVEL